MNEGTVRQTNKETVKLSSTDHSTPNDGLYQAQTVFRKNIMSQFAPELSLRTPGPYCQGLVIV